MPVTYRIRLHKKTIDKINQDKDTFLIIVTLLEGEIDYKLIIKQLQRQRINKQKVLIMTSCFTHLNNSYGLKFIYIDYWESFTDTLLCNC